VAKIDKKELEKKLEDQKALPACPAVVSAVSRIARDPKSTARDLGKIISTDKALTAKVLKVVNSAFYGMPGTISTVTQAVVILGFQEIKNLVYSIPSSELFKEGGVENGIDLSRLWKHSVVTAVISREIAYNIRYNLPEEAFVAGLIHDIGKVVLNKFLGPAYRGVAEMSMEDPFAEKHLAAEKEELGSTHSEMGQMLAAHWTFPRELQDAVQFHHEPTSHGMIKTLPAIVNAANIIARGLPRDDEPEAIAAHIHKGIFNFLQMSNDKLVKMIEKAHVELKKVDDMFRIR